MDGFALPDAGNVSDAVRAAQEKLLEIRRARGIDGHGRFTHDELRITNSESGATSYERRVTSSEAAVEAPDLTSLLESGRAYHSETLTQHLRAAAKRRGRVTNDELRATSGEAPPAPFSPSPLPPISPSLHVKVYPDLALGILRRKKAAAGRVWLLLRHSDAAGRGRVAVAEAVRLLTAGGSPLRICGRRQLGNLLRAGEGCFWERDIDGDGREWLRLFSAVRVAAGLGVARLGGSPVAVPVDALTGTIGQARAHLYASFHSGRDRAGLLSGQKRPRGPIARATLSALCGAAPNSQRNYERRARVTCHSAVAVGPRVNATDEHDEAWRRGRALFHLTDHAGRFGRPGATYLAWQLPNEYTGPHDTLPRGRQKRLNRALADLFHDGMTGNGGQPKAITNYELRITNSEVVSGSVGQLETEFFPANSCSPNSVSGGMAAVVPQKRFYANGKAADRARHSDERYWRYGGVWLWQPEIRDVKQEIRTGVGPGHLPPATSHPEKSS